MSKQLAFLEYTFILDPTNTFQHVYEFEKFLSDFLKTRGLEGQIMETVAGGVNGKKIILISKVKDIPVSEPTNPVGRPKSPGSQLKDMARRKYTVPALKFQGKR